MCYIDIVNKGKEPKMTQIKITETIRQECLESELENHHSVYAKIKDATPRKDGSVLIDCTPEEVKELRQEADDRSRASEWIEGFPWRAYLALRKQIIKKQLEEKFA